MRIALNGARGRMGRMVLEAAAAEPGVEVTALLEAPGHAEAGRVVTTPWGDRIVGTDVDAIPAVDVGIDFSQPAGALPFARALAARGVPVAVCTTGLSTADLDALRQAATGAPVLVASNTSVGVHVLQELSRLARRLLGPSYDVEIVEVHHRHKRDAPSGTAMTLAEALAEDGGLRPVTAREGQCGPRQADELGVVAVRGGEVVGDHTIHFLGDHDRLEITHRASSRYLLAQGAVALARRLPGRLPGLLKVADLFRDA